MKPNGSDQISSRGKPPRKIPFELKIANLCYDGCDVIAGHPYIRALYQSFTFMNFRSRDNIRVMPIRD